ncbi:MAG: nuclear transport factor 2 family protein [Chloroflexota bacterium]
MGASRETVMAVEQVLDRFADAYAAKDVSALLGCFAVGDDGVLIGTGADEWRVGEAAVRAQAERDFAQADALSVEYHELHVDGMDGIAWFAAKGTVRATLEGEPFEAAVRLSGVLTHEADAWLIVSAHLSFPAVEQEPGHSF